VVISAVASIKRAKIENKRRSEKQQRHHVKTWRSREKAISINQRKLSVAAAPAAASSVSGIVKRGGVIINGGATPAK